MKESIGNVGFIRRGKQYPNGFEWARLIGDARVDALCRFYRKESLGDLIPYSLQGRGELKWKNVRWDTSGIPELA